MRKQPPVRYQGDVAYITIGTDTKGKTAELIVDKSKVDFVLSAPTCWFVRVPSSGNGQYVARRQRVDGKRKFFVLHRILVDAPSDMVVDHINRNTLDNRLSNLRVVSVKENNRNKVPPKNLTGVPNVGYDKQRNMFTVFFSFDTIEEAKVAADAVRKLRGY